MSGRKKRQAPSIPDEPTPLRAKGNNKSEEQSSKPNKKPAAKGSKAPKLIALEVLNPSWRRTLFFFSSSFFFSLRKLISTDF